MLRRIKQQAIAENVMEIITCGAVSPYQQLLGGKLVAMLMTSPQVVRDVKQAVRGQGQPHRVGHGWATDAPQARPGDA